MSTVTPTVVLVHGAFADSSSWDGVVEQLRSRSVETVAVANPLRSLAGDAAYVRDVVAAVGGPVLLVGHSYGGMVITQAAVDAPAVRGLVYVAAFAPQDGESAFELSGRFPGSTLGAALDSYPLASGATDLRIEPGRFPEQFAADVPLAYAQTMAVAQRPITEEALRGSLMAPDAPWQTLPSWFVYGADDRNIPAELQRFMALRAGARTTREVEGASHALAVSRPHEVTRTLLGALGLPAQGEVAA
ncbi:alpha/beta fold hydrolase [Luteimicrobium sp. DT211]|uniref:alpha/beta fold hydrolase n=1 Tax=Luteimicrobium sp. DT211 TaxID=3393412 RepID=UPI003CFBBE49